MSQLALELGIDVVIDTTCPDSSDNDSVGCFGRCCRLCQSFATERSLQYWSCTNFESPVESELENATAFTCSYSVSPADASAGIGVIIDSACIAGGEVGCMGESACRLCKTATTPLSDHLMSCAALLLLRSTLPLTSSSDPAPVISASASASAPAAVIDVDGDVDTPATNFCSAYLIDDAQLRAGIWAVVDDAACAANPTACELEICQRCKYIETSASVGLRPCPSDDQWLLSYVSTLEPSTTTDY